MTTSYGGAKLGTWRQFGVTRLVVARVLIGGLGTLRPFDIILERLGSNWLVADVASA